MARDLRLLPGREVGVEVRSVCAALASRRRDLLADGGRAVAGLERAQFLDLGLDLGHRFFEVEIAAHVSIRIRVRSQAAAIRIAEPDPALTDVRSCIRPLVVEVGAAFLRLEVAFDVAERVHGAAQPLADQLVELDRLREREVAAHLHGDLVMLERRQMARGDLARDRDRVRFELGRPAPPG